jgi:hypothetical protein
MEWFGKSRIRNQLMTPEDAGNALHQSARDAMNPELYCYAEENLRRFFGSLVCATNFAVTIQCLKVIEERSESRNSERARAILDVFECLVFSALGPTQRDQLVGDIRSLMSLSIKLEQIVQDKTLPPDEATNHMITWFRLWLKIMWDDESFLTDAGMHYFALIAFIHDCMYATTKAVESVMYGNELNL